MQAMTVRKIISRKISQAKEKGCKIQNKQRTYTVAAVYMYISSKAVGQGVRHQEDESWHRSQIQKIKKTIRIQNKFKYKAYKTNKSNIKDTKILL